MFTFQKLKDVSGRFGVACKYISLARNAIVVLFGTILAYCLTTDDRSPFSLTGLLNYYYLWISSVIILFLGEVKAGLPDVKIPPFSTVVGNQTLGYGEILSHLGTSIISIPMV